MRWQVLQEKTPKNKEELLEVLFKNREITDREHFTHPPHPSTFTPTSVGINEEQLAVAVKRILEAVAKKQKILIYGDYDADGICATTVLWKTLNSLGADAVPFIPIREKHGYGISSRALPDIEEIKPELIITVDNGIVAHSTFATLAEKGYDCILTDHHQPEVDTETQLPYYPQALAIVHTTALCGTTVAWMLSKELSSYTVNDLLDLCAIASVADQVLMLNANRSFVYHGLQTLRTTDRLGILELCAVAGIQQSEITSYSIGYQIGPRINAMGRIAHGMDALRLLCTESKNQAVRLAASLQQTNVNRQDLTMEMYQDALIQAHEQTDQKLIFVYSVDYHEGVIGLIAGKLTETFAKPAIALSINGETAKASARSIAGVSIIDLLRAVREDLLEVGGHPLAGGFSVLSEKIEIVKNRLHQLARAAITDTDLQPILSPECVLDFSLILPETIKEIQVFEPYGQGNPKPYFIVKNLRVRSIQTIGKEGQHRKFLFCSATSEPAQNKDIVALWWNIPTGLEINPDQEVEIVASLELNSYKGRISTQLIVKDLHT